MDDTAFLSVRVPQDVRNRIKAIAAQRGEKLQDLVGSLIERFLEENERRPPFLPDILQRLRGLEAGLRDKHVTHLWVFGSVARGDARADSDVDLLIEYLPGKEPTLFAQLHLKDEFQSRLGHPVDLGERSALKPDAEASAKRDMVQVF